MTEQESAGAAGFYALEQGVLRIPYRRRPLIQITLPLSFIPVFACLTVWLALSLRVGHLGFAMSHWSAAVAAAALALSVIWLVIQIVIVMRQRARAVDIAEARWNGDVSHEGQAQFCSLVFSYAGCTRTSIAPAWRHLGAIQLVIYSRCLLAQPKPTQPFVWVFNDAPTDDAVEFLNCSDALLISHLRFGRFTAPRGQLTAAGCIFGGGFIGLLPIWFPSLPWRTSDLVIGICLLAGAGVGFLLNHLTARYGSFLWRHEGLTYIIKNRPVAGVAPDGLHLEHGGATWIVTPRYESQVWGKPRAHDGATLHLRTIGYPMIAADVEPGDVRDSDDAEDD